MPILGARIDAIESLIGTGPSQIARRPEGGRGFSGAERALRLTPRKPGGPVVLIRLARQTRLRRGYSGDAPLCPPRLLSGEDLVAFAIEDTHADRLRRPL